MADTRETDQPSVGHNACESSIAGIGRCEVSERPLILASDKPKTRIHVNKPAPRRLPYNVKGDTAKERLTAFSVLLPELREVG